MPERGFNDPVVIMTTRPKHVNVGDTNTDINTDINTDTNTDTRISTIVDTDGVASQSEGAEARHVHAMKGLSNAH
ncbi:hypothetical protein GCM10010307_02680 [Streptomyces vastus]|uniref:Uncharacterized protein n=1 Tax=Streptomyces vastus TaxID=285451 RepID=A0ABN3Q894_9ACTN